jgi:hypothetical protein
LPSVALLQLRQTGRPPADEGMQIRVVQQRRHLPRVLHPERLQPYPPAEQRGRVRPVAEVAHQAGGGGAAATSHAAQTGSPRRSPNRDIARS